VEPQNLYGKSAVHAVGPSSSSAQGAEDRGGCASIPIAHGKKKGRSEMKCKICNKKAVENYCKLHTKAYKNIVQKYDEWTEAVDISWKEYLNEVAANSNTGIWAKEVAEQLLSETE